MNNKIPIFPNIRLRGDMFETRVRIYHEGRWYFSVVREYHRKNLPEYDPQQIFSDTISRFNYNIYQTILHGMVNPALEVFELDPDQRSEQTRMLDLIKGK